MRVLVIALLVAGLGGCASVTKIESGERTIGDRMSIYLEGDWNQVNAPGMGPAQTWTMEGLPVDQLLIYAGLKDGEAVHAGGASASAGRKSFDFRSSMQPDEIVALFEGMMTRDGSAFNLVKLEPSGFGGQKGFRFEYTLTRRVDNLQLSGIGYGAVNRGELFAMLYIAPRLTFFARHKNRVEQIARSARVKG